MLTACLRERSQRDVAGRGGEGGSQSRVSACRLSSALLARRHAGRFRVSLALGHRGYGDQFDAGLSEAALLEDSEPVLQRGSKSFR